VLPLANEFIVFWGPFIKFDQVETNNRFKTIAQEIKRPILIIKLEAKNTGYIIELIKVYLNLVGDVNPNPVRARRNCQNCLIVIGHELVWLVKKGLFKTIDRCHFFCFKIKFKDFVSFCEQDGVSISLEIMLEVVEHANLVKDWNIFDHNSFVKLKLVIFKLTRTLDSLENEELILLLLTHNEVFTTENGKPVLIFRFLKSDNLIRLSGICVK
jgi:hypothetical protein